MKILKIYLLSLLSGYVTFVLIGSMVMLAQIGVLGKGIIVILIGGLFYIPLYAVSNLTQFLLIKYPNQNKLAFLLPIIIIWLIVSIAVLTNKMDDFIWKIMVPSQIIVSFIGYKLYKTKNVKGD